MSPVMQLIEMQQRLLRHNKMVQRRRHIKSQILSELDEMAKIKREADQVEYDQHHIKVNGREG